MFRLNAGSLAVAAFIAFPFAGTGALAADPEPSTKDLNSFKCKEVMRMSGEDRTIALALVHGYVLGKKGTTRYDIEVLSQITDKFMDYCLDHPAENALKSFEKIAK